MRTATYIQSFHSSRISSYKLPIIYEELEEESLLVGMIRSLQATDDYIAEQWALSVGVIDCHGVSSSYMTPCKVADMEGTSARKVYQGFVHALSHFT
jgi:hypothetical protein